LEAAGEQQRGRRPQARARVGVEAVEGDGVSHAARLGQLAQLAQLAAIAVHVEPRLRLPTAYERQRLDGVLDPLLLLQAGEYDEPRPLPLRQSVGWLHR